MYNVLEFKVATIYAYCNVTTLMILAEKAEKWCANDLWQASPSCTHERSLLGSSPNPLHLLELPKYAKLPTLQKGGSAYEG